MWLLASLALADPCDDAAVLREDLDLALDVADRSAWAIRDAETLVVARQVWALREGRLRGNGEAALQEELDVRLGRALYDLAYAAKAVDGSYLSFGSPVHGIQTPLLVGLDRLEPELALQFLQEEAEALGQARAAYVESIEAAGDCGLDPIDDPGPASARSPWSEWLAAHSEGHLVGQASLALTRLDHLAATLEAVIDRIAELAGVSSLAYEVDDNERAHLQDGFAQLSQVVDALADKTTWHGQSLAEGGSAGEIVLPDLSAWGLAVDTATMDVSTAAGADASLRTSVPFAYDVLAAVREGIAADQADLVQPVVPAAGPRVDGAVLPGDCAVMETRMEDLAYADTELDAWDQEAQEVEALLVRLQALRLRHQTEVRPDPLRIPDGSALLDLLADQDEESFVYVDVGGIRTRMLELTEPGLVPDLGETDALGLSTLEAIVAAREQLAADRWRVTADRALLRFHATRGWREAMLCGQSPPRPSALRAPGDPDEAFIQLALAQNRADGHELLAFQRTVLDDVFEEIDGMTARADEALLPGADLPTLQDAFVAHIERIDELSQEEWLGIPPFDGSLATLVVTTGSEAGFDTDLTLGDCKTWTLGLDTGTLDPMDLGTASDDYLYLLLDLARGSLGNYASNAQAADERLSFEDAYADGL